MSLIQCKGCAGLEGKANILEVALWSDVPISWTGGEIRGVQHLRELRQFNLDASTVDF